MSKDQKSISTYDTDALRAAFAEIPDPSKDWDLRFCFFVDDLGRSPRRMLRWTGNILALVTLPYFIAAYCLEKVRHR